jgi:N-acetylneuraminic acid mutarotase
MKLIGINVAHLLLDKGMRKLIYIAVFGYILQVGYATGFWEKAGELPIPVYGAKAIVKDSLIYIIGGYSDTQEMALDTIQIYDPRHDVWPACTHSLFVDRYGLNAHVYGDSLIVFGGVFDDSFLVFALEKWDFTGDPVIHSYNFNFNRFFATSEIYHDYLYIFGGFPNYDWVDENTAPQYLVKYHLPSATVVDSPKVNRFYSDYLPSRQMSALMGNSIYLFGGEYNGVLNDIDKYDTTLDTSMTVSKLRRERSCGSAVVLDSELIIIIGGVDGDNRILRETEIYNIRENLVYDGPSLLKPRSEIAAVLYQDTVYVFGGKDSNGKAVIMIEKIALQAIYDYITTITADFADKSMVASTIALHNFPNPFNARTTIKYQLPMTSEVELSVYNMLGQKVVTLVSQRQPSGQYSVNWDGSDMQQQLVPSGLYFCRLTTGTQSITHKLILLK